jgi:predicted nucleic acid-binding Zn ribbon protein
MTNHQQSDGLVLEEKRTCVVCSADISNMRKDAIYCSQSCSSKAYRRRKKRAEALQQSMLETLEDSIEAQTEQNEGNVFLKVILVFTAVALMLCGAYVAFSFPNFPSNDNPPHLDTALAYVNMQETGENRGIADRFNEFVNAPLGSPYCASFTSYCNHKGNAPIKLKTAWSRGFASSKIGARDIRDVFLGIYEPKPGDLLVWKRKRGGHIGFVTVYRKSSKTFFTVEANTSNGLQGSQWNGGGIYERNRVYKPFSAFRLTHIVPNH